jgi:hypothetical protein
MSSFDHEKTAKMFFEKGDEVECLFPRDRLDYNTIYVVRDTKGLAHWSTGDVQYVNLVGLSASYRSDRFRIAKPLPTLEELM